MMQIIAGIITLIIIFVVTLNYQNNVIKKRELEIRNLRVSIEFFIKQCESKAIAEEAKGQIKQINKEKNNVQDVRIGDNSRIF